MKINTSNIDTAIKLRHEITLMVSCGNYTKAKAITKKYVSYCKKHNIQT